MAPQCLVPQVRLDEVCAELHLFMEELGDDIAMVTIVRRGCRALYVGLLVPLSNLAQLSGQGFQQVLTVVEAAVIGDVHGHPKPGGGQLIVQNLERLIKTLRIRTDSKHLSI